MKKILFSLVILAFIGLLFYSAIFVREYESVQKLVESFGFFGILGVAFMSGLNVVIPVPAATFTPIFLEAGFALSVVITGFVIGTTAADSVGYCIGHFTKDAAREKYPKLHKKICTFGEQHHHLILPAMFLWSGFAPLPNEVALIPLGIIGIKFRYLLIPLILGTIVHQTWLSFGFVSLFTTLLN